ncbi:unnamed protein product [Cylindrotheca closterium]|uniref:Uncharacterized protein n=1 Tax=Cylindrotheca closterium TaxID=2856 RepID=A0AAD2FIL1_9STRA|nr:unnamed protein product [Cylindrotheca closterium]
MSRTSRPSFSNKLRTSIFSDASSFIDEWSSAESSAQRGSLEHEKQRVSQLLDELEAYEKELSQGHSDSQLEREALEFELQKQTDRNQELEAMIAEMEAKMEELVSALHNQEDDQMLLVENEILKKRLEQKESAMLSMSSMHSINNRSYSSDLPLVEEDDLNTHLSVDTDGSDDEGFEKPSAKLQGDLLQSRAKLAEKDRTIKAQAEEIQSLRRECEDYKDDEAREKMKSYIEGLEKEKKFFVAEIAKLKEANEKAAINMSSSSTSLLPTSSLPRQSISSLGMASLTEDGTTSTMDDSMSTEDVPFLPWGGSYQNVNSRVSNTSTSASTQNATSQNRRQSASAWRSFSTRLFGGIEEVDDAPLEEQTEADKMLDDLTKDM